MRKNSLNHSLLFQGGILMLLFLLQFILPTYHHSSVSKIMLLASYAIGYNFLLGYTGLMSLGHAMFFSSGMYSMGLGIYYLELSPLNGVIFSASFSLMVSLIFGLFALRTSGVSFLIVTLMFGQTFYLSILYFNEFTFGHDGFSLAKYLGSFVIFGKEYLFSNPDIRYNFALLLLTSYLLITTFILLSPVGRILIAIRENESRTQLLGYNVFYYKLFALVLSGTFSGVAGAMHGLLFSYIGTTFAEIHHSISPLLWTLLGGAGTVIGPLFGTGIMYYLIDFISEITKNYLLVVGIVLILMIIWFPLGIMGSVRRKWLKWLP
ncbi:MAG: branched-chain amino acid ABC transporter permease [SAR324 cluster bacterium]|nr:branched-chain amino acid ABC transporter permease [SAR324 cluster bacterium]|tara:strand:+ start:1606 stop:2568 length:963 start_codon:yes stop_codon:yes gene_type:complete